MPLRTISAVFFRHERRLASFVDQSMFSLASFILTLVLIRAYPKDEFAAYGIGLFAALVLAGVYRVSFAIPVALWLPREFRLRRKAIPALHFIVIASVLLSLAVITLTLGLLHATELAIRVTASLAAAASVYLSLDIDRVLLFRARTPREALSISTLYSSAIMFSGVCFFLFHPPFIWAMGALTMLGLVKTVFVGTLSGYPDWSHGSRLMKRLLRTAVGWNTVGSLACSSFLIVPQWILGLFTTPSQVAGFTAVRTPMQPLMVIIRSMDIIDKITSGSLNDGDPRLLRKHYWRAYLIYLAMCVTFCVAISFSADAIVEALLTAQYEEFAWTLRWTAFLLVLTATSAPLETIVYQQRSYRSYAISQIMGGCIGAVCALPLSLHLGASGAVIASILGWIVPYGFLLQRLVRTTSAIAQFRESGAEIPLKSR